MKFLRRAAWALIVLVLALAAVAWVYARRAQPQISGELALPGASSPVTIARDADGVPTIRAADMPGLAYGLGFVHAQDRLWQMETHRRIGAGRLAEAFGAAALPTDRFLRALGVRRAAAAQWAHLSPESRAVMQAYARGVDDYVHHGLKARPPEFLILGLPVDDWDPVDSLSWLIMMAWDLGGNWNSEILRMRLAQRLPVERIAELLPPYPGDAPQPTADYAALYRSLGLARQAVQTALAPSDRLFERFAGSGIEGMGSNNWVVAASHSATGHPLLANDPHLKLSAPALWYFVRLEAPGLRAAGATMPGLPNIVLGQTDRIAWGFTNTAPDVQDLYLEQLDEAARTRAAQGRARTPEGWAPLERFDETIRVRGAPDEHLVVRVGRHGPLISDAGGFDDLLGGAPAKPAYALAMRWTALDPDADLLAANLKMLRARSVGDFVEATRGWVAPMQNMVVADRDDHIGLIAPGRVPLRRPGNDLHGLAPAPGWDARYDWDGWLPFDALPQERDPARGFIATANQKIVGPDYPHYLTSEWAAPYRWQRIVQRLEAKPRLGIEDLASIQADIRSLATLKLLPFLNQAHGSHPLAAAARRELEGFDGTMAGERAAPLIFWSWTRHLTRLVFADELGPLFDRSFGGRSFRDALEGVLERNDAWWCDDKTTPAAETCAMLIDRAFDLALDELQASQGPDPARWRWDAVHVARSEHRPFSHVAGLARWFELRAPVGGDTYTVNAARVALTPDPDHGQLYLDEHGPSLRAIYDLADPSRSRFVFSSGQSGLFWSPLYRNLVAPWTRVEDRPLWGDPGQSRVLRLVPGG